MPILRILISFILIIIAVLAFDIKVLSAQNVAPYVNNKDFSKNKNYVFAVSGIVNSTLAKSNQKNIYNNNILPDGFSKNYHHDFMSMGLDNQSFAKGAVKFNDNNYLGITTKIELNYNSNSRQENPNIDQFFSYLESDFGKFEFGNFVAVNQRMKYGPANFARGAGGIKGKYLEYVNLPVLAQNNSLCGGNILSINCRNVRHPRFITLAQSPIGHGGYAKGFYPRDVDNIYNSPAQTSYFNRTNFRALKDDSYDGLEDALKLSFYSKKINQFQFGVSYAPRSQNQGFTAKTAQDSQDVKLNNLLSFGMNYSNDFDNLNLAVSTTGEYAKSKALDGVNRNNLLAYDVGVNASYFGFTIGASYGSWGRSLYAKNGTYSCNYDDNKNLVSQNCDNHNKKLADSYYYTTGIAYEIGPIKSSITSINSDFQKNKYSAISFGLDYKIRKNLITYFEITDFNFKNNNSLLMDYSSQIKVANSANNIKNNSGKVFLYGIYYIF